MFKTTMMRKRVMLASIENEASRKANFKKSTKGLSKKVNELSTLCGIESCTILYGPHNPEPEVWPSALGVRRTIARFRNISEMEQSKRMINQVAFIKQQISMAYDHLKKQLRENREREVTTVMHRALLGHGLNLLDVNDLSWLMDKNLRENDEQIKLLKKNPCPTDPPESAPAAAKCKSTAKVEAGEPSGIPGDGSALGLGTWTMYMDLVKSNDDFGRTTDDGMWQPRHSSS